MKKYIAILIMLILTSCFSDKSRQEKTRFYNDVTLPYELTIFHLDSKEELLENIKDVKYYGTNTFNISWFRERGNMGLLHGILKKIGYKNIIDSSKFQSKIRFYDLPNKDWGINSYSTLIDTLISTNKELDQLSPNNYFRKFWKRRQQEGNNDILLTILTDIKYRYSTKVKRKLIYDKNQPELYDLIHSNLELINSYDNAGIIKYFYFLKKMKLNYSAMIFLRKNDERFDNKTIDSLISQLIEVKKNQFKNKSEWVKYEFDNGP
ncbi:MAG: hypothetical protein JKY08_06230 [Flavobacteriaceae bacterium]|nr:hypothetical protein [Flavobacteriaceae bacterium]